MVESIDAIETPRFASAGRTNASAPTRAWLHPGCACCCVTAMQSQANTALIVELCGRAPVDVIGADDARASADQSVGDPVLGIAISAYRKNRAAIQNEHRHPRRALDICG